MSRVSDKVKDYQSARGTFSTQMSIFDTIQEVLNTMFDIRCSTKKKWGYEWYDLARYGCYEEARKALITKPACLSKTVALKCINDLEMLNAQLNALERGENNTHNA
jgi:hypothetical protein